MPPGRRHREDARSGARGRESRVARAGRIEAWTAIAAVETAHEVELLRAGGVLPAILRRALKR
jgi:aconitate hydratase A / 2-methylisocitrate dehydratase